MPLWRRNLVVCWFGIFIASIGMSQLAPVLPLYIKHLGVGDTAMIEKYSGLAFGITFILSAVFSPIWGLAADKYGRKPMLLRASLGMAIVIGSMGFARNVHELVGLRLLQGAITGYSTACTTLIATQTDKEHAGWALGTLSTAGITGTLIGPMLGGYISDAMGLRPVFFIIGALVFVSFVATALFVKESFVRSGKKASGMMEIWTSLPDKALMGVLLATAFMLSLGMYSIEPIITVYISRLAGTTEHVALVAGIAFSASGLASIIAAPGLGKLSDRIGPQRVMLVALAATGIVIIPQALVRTQWQLAALRFLLGLAIAGLNPALNALVKQVTPERLTGRVFGFLIGAQYLGVFFGAVLGGQVAAGLGIRYVFFFTSAAFLVNFAWVFFKIFRRPRREVEHGEIT